MRGLPSVIARQLQNLGPSLRKNTYAVLRCTDPIDAQYYTFQCRQIGRFWRTANLACDRMVRLALGDATVGFLESQPIPLADTSIGVPTRQRPASVQALS